MAPVFQRLAQADVHFAVAGLEIDGGAIKRSQEAPGVNCLLDVHAEFQDVKDQLAHRLHPRRPPGLPATSRSCPAASNTVARQGFCSIGWAMGTAPRNRRTSVWPEAAS